MPTRCAHCGCLLAEATSEQLCETCLQVQDASDTHSQATSGDGAAALENTPRRGSTAGSVDETQAFNPSDSQRAIAPTLGPSGNAVAAPDVVGHESGQPGAPLGQFGDYELLEEIARGGMGVVYKARQASLNRIVALKMMLQGRFATELDQKRFLVEAEAAANLDHPGIVPVYEFGEHQGTYFFSMAYVEGPSLATMAAAEPFTPTRAAELTARVAEAIAYAHRRGIVHRDLKPANILIDPSGQPRVTDFGLAKRIDAKDELTQDGTILGSAFFMPPEQATGKAAHVGPASDVYALGAILYKLLIGSPPFEAQSVIETLTQIVEQEPVPPRRINPRIPPDLETICLKCLQKDVARRFASADELADELHRFLRGEPVRSRPVGRWQRAWRWCRRNPMTAALTTGLLLTLLVGVVTATTLLNRARAERLRSEQQQRAAAVLSDLVMQKTLEETRDWLDLFFEPVEQQLLVVRDWTRYEVLDIDQPELANRLLMPVIGNHSQISSVAVADDRGREHILFALRPAGPRPERINWKCRQARRDEWQDEVRWLEWRGDRSSDAVSRVSTEEYDPRNRPWFQGARSLGAADPASSDAAAVPRIHWTEPYIFFTSKKLGITASTVADRDQAEAPSTVVALDILLEDITRFTVDKHPTPGGMVLVLTADGRLVGLPNTVADQTSQQWQSLFLQPLLEIDQPAIQSAAQAFRFEHPEEPEFHDFQCQGQQWRGAAATFRLGESLTLWILVLLPESDLAQSLTAKSNRSQPDF